MSPEGRERATAIYAYGTDKKNAARTLAACALHDSECLLFTVVEELAHPLANPCVAGMQDAQVQFKNLGFGLWSRFNVSHGGLSRVVVLRYALRVANARPRGRLSDFVAGVHDQAPDGVEQPFPNGTVRNGGVRRQGRVGWDTPRHLCHESDTPLGTMCAGGVSAMLALDEGGEAQ